MAGRWALRGRGAPRSRGATLSHVTEPSFHSQRYERHVYVKNGLQADEMPEEPLPESARAGLPAALQSDWANTKIGQWAKKVLLTASESPDSNLNLTDIDEREWSSDLLTAAQEISSPTRPYEKMRRSTGPTPPRSDSPSPQSLSDTAQCSQPQMVPAFSTTMRAISTRLGALRELSSPLGVAVPDTSATADNQHVLHSLAFVTTPPAGPSYSAGSPGATKSSVSLVPSDSAQVTGHVTESMVVSRPPGVTMTIPAIRKRAVSPPQRQVKYSRCGILNNGLQLPTLVARQDEEGVIYGDGEKEAFARCVVDKMSAAVPPEVSQNGSVGSPTIVRCIQNTPSTNSMLQTAPPHVNITLQNAPPYVNTTLQAAPPFLNTTSQNDLLHMNITLQTAPPYVETMLQKAPPYVNTVLQYAPPPVNTILHNQDHLSFRVNSTISRSPTPPPVIQKSSSPPTGPSQPREIYSYTHPVNGRTAVPESPDQLEDAFLRGESAMSIASPASSRSPTPPQHLPYRHRHLSSPPHSYSPPSQRQDRSRSRSPSSGSNSISGDEVRRPRSRSRSPSPSLASSMSISRSGSLSPASSGSDSFSPRRSPRRTSHSSAPSPRSADSSSCASPDSNTSISLQHSHSPSPPPVMPRGGSHVTEHGHVSHELTNQLRDKLKKLNEEHEFAFNFWSETAIAGGGHIADVTFDKAEVDGASRGPTRTWFLTLLTKLLFLEKTEDWQVFTTLSGPTLPTDLPLQSDLPPPHLSLFSASLRHFVFIYLPLCASERFEFAAAARYLSDQLRRDLKVTDAAISLLPTLLPFISQDAVLLSQEVSSMLLPPPPPHTWRFPSVTVSSLQVVQYLRNWLSPTLSSAWQLITITDQLRRTVPEIFVSQEVEVVWPDVVAVHKSRQRIYCLFISWRKGASQSLLKALPFDVKCVTSEVLLTDATVEIYEKALEIFPFYRSNSQ